MLSLAANTGWPAFWWLGSGAIGLGALGLLFAKRVRSSNASTLPEILNLYLDNKCRILASLIVLASSIAIVAAQFNALGVILATFAVQDFTWSVIAGAAGIWLYTCMGGQEAVIKSDLWQFFLLSLALCCAFACLMQLPPCRLALFSSHFQWSNQELPFLRILYFIIVFGSSFTIGPMIFGRLLSAKSPAAAKNGSLAAAIGLALMALLITSTGIAISGLDIPAADPEQLLSVVCHQALPDGAVWLLIIGLLAAVVSSADSCLLTAAIVLSHDLHAGGTVGSTRLAISIIAIASCAIVFCGRTILGLLLAASDIYTCGIVAPAIILLLRNQRSNPSVFFWAMAGGGCFGLLAAISGNYLWSFAGLALSGTLALSGNCKRLNP